MWHTVVLWTEGIGRRITMRFSQAWVISEILSEKSKWQRMCRLWTTAFAPLVLMELMEFLWVYGTQVFAHNSTVHFFLTSLLGICDVAEAEARSSRNDMKNSSICFTAELHCFVEEFHPMSCLQAFHLGFFKVTLTLDWHVHSGKIGNFQLR